MYSKQSFELYITEMKCLVWLLRPAHIIIFALFLFHYLRLVVHIFAAWIYYKPTALPKYPTLTPKSCTVIIPTVEPDNDYFKICLESVFANSPSPLLIVTVGPANRRRAEEVVKPFRQEHPDIQIQVKTTRFANKRRQICAAVDDIKTQITLLVDDHVSWPSKNFLPSILVPFEDKSVGLVGMNNSARHFNYGISWPSFWNMIGSLYLERHKYESRATSAMDGSVYVIAGRTSAHRTPVLKDLKFIEAFTNAYVFFEKVGPLNADDDNLITRWYIGHGWKVSFQDCEDARIETTVGSYPRFLSQCLRWARTTWRSNGTVFFTDGGMWYKHPWCIYAVYMTSFTNMALFYDAALLSSLHKCNFGRTATLGMLVAWILFHKIIKVEPYFLRHPKNVIYLPAYIIFIYYHSLIKLWAGLTFWDTTWGSRVLEGHGTGDDCEASPSSDKDEKEVGHKVQKLALALSDVGSRRRKRAGQSMSFDLDVVDCDNNPARVSGLENFATDKVKLTTVNSQWASEESIRECSSLVPMDMGLKITSRVQNEVTVEALVRRKK
jgi:hypothetical protein